MFPLENLSLLLTVMFGPQCSARPPNRDTSKTPERAPVTGAPSKQLPTSAFTNGLHRVDQEQAIVSVRKGSLPKLSSNPDRQDCN